MSSQKEQELEKLKERILTMGGFVEDAIRKSIKALVERDRALAIQVIDGDAIVNNFDVEIEEECIRFLAIWQPTGSNLRLVTTAIKIITDLERMGDLAVDICERAMELLDEPPLKPYIDIPRMAEAAQKMLKDSLDAFVAQDADLAMRVCEDDDFVDNLNVQIFNELLLYHAQGPEKHFPRRASDIYHQIPGTHRGPCHQYCRDGGVHGQGKGHPSYGVRDTKEAVRAKVTAHCSYNRAVRPTLLLMIRCHLSETEGTRNCSGIGACHTPSMKPVQTGALRSGYSSGIITRNPLSEKIKCLTNPATQCRISFQKIPHPVPEQGTRNVRSPDTLKTISMRKELHT